MGLNMMKGICGMIRFSIVLTALYSFMHVFPSAAFAPVPYAPYPGLESVRL